MMKSALFLLLGLVASAAEAQLLQPRSQLFSDPTFRRFVQVKEGEYQIDGSRLLLTEKNGVVTRVTLEMAEATLDQMIDLQNFLGGHGHDPARASTFRDFYQKNLSHIQGRDGLVFHDAYHSIRLQARGKGYSLNLERYSYPLSNFPTTQAVINPSGARNTLSIFTSFDCASCRSMWLNVLPTWQKQAAQLGLSIRVYHYPTPDSENAMLMAVGAECAGQQNKFWEFANNAYQDWSWVRQYPAQVQEWIVGSGQQLRLNRAAFESCLKDPNVQKNIKNHVYSADGLGLSALPSIYVNGTRVIRWQDGQEVAILSQLAR